MTTNYDSGHTPLGPANKAEALETFNEDGFTETTATLGGYRAWVSELNKHEEVILRFEPEDDTVHARLTVYKVIEAANGAQVDAFYCTISLAGSPYGREIRVIGGGFRDIKIVVHTLTGGNLTLYFSQRMAESGHPMLPEEGGVPVTLIDAGALDAEGDAFVEAMEPGGSVWYVFADSASVVWSLAVQHPLEDPDTGWWETIHGGTGVNGVALAMPRGRVKASYSNNDDLFVVRGLLGA